MEKGLMSEETLAFLPPGKPPEHIHPLVLAYVGDTLHDLFIRQYVVAQANHRPNHLHQTASQYVSAKSQARTLERLQSILTDEERDVIRKGRNVKSGTTAKNAGVLEYRHSTAFECLLGFLYYKRRFARINELLRFSVEPDPAEDEAKAIEKKGDPS